MISGTSVGSIFVSIGADASGLVTGFSKAEREIERFGSRVFFLGSRMTAGVTLPIVALTSAVMKLGSEFDKAMTESLAIMDNVTPKIRRDMEEVARTISETSKYSATEAAKGYYHLASAGYTAVESMKLLPVTTKFAQAGVMDLAKATELLAGAQQSLGMRMKDPVENAREMARVADVLTEANNRALGTIEDFAQAITNKAGAQLKIYNKTVEEGTAALMALASQNVKGRLAGQQLYMVMRDLARFSLKNVDAWKQYKVAVFDGTGQMRNIGNILMDMERAFGKLSTVQQTAAWSQMGFTDRTRAAIQYLLYSGKAIKDYERALLSAAGSTEKVAAKQMEAFANKLSVLWNKIKNVVIELFRAFVPTIEGKVIPVIERFLEKASELAKRISGWSDETKVLVMQVIALAAALGPLITILGSNILFGSAILGGISAVGEGIRGIVRGVKIATEAWKDYTKAQGAASLAQSFQWASAAFGPAAAAGKSAASPVGPGGSAAISQGLSSWLASAQMAAFGRTGVTLKENVAEQRKVMEAALKQSEALLKTSMNVVDKTVRESLLKQAIAIETAAALQVAAMRNASNRSAGYMAKMTELTKGARNHAIAFTAEWSKSEGIIGGIIGRLISLFTKLGSFFPTILKIGGPLAVIVGTIRFFADSWTQVGKAIGGILAPLGLVIGSMNRLSKALGIPTIKELTRVLEENMGTWRDWFNLVGDVGSFIWNVAHAQITGLERLFDTMVKLGEKATTAAIEGLRKYGLFIVSVFAPQVAAALRSIGPDRVNAVVESSVKTSVRTAMQAIPGLGGLFGQQPKGYDSLPKTLSTYLNASPFMLEENLNAAKGARTFFDKQYSDLPKMGGGFQAATQPEVNQLMEAMASLPPGATMADRQAAFNRVMEQQRKAWEDATFGGDYPGASKEPKYDREGEARKNLFSEMMYGQDEELKRLSLIAADISGMFADEGEVPIQILERLWGAYKKFKEELAPGEIVGNVKVLDDMTKVLWEQVYASQELASALPHGWWGTMAKDTFTADKELQNFVATFDNLSDTVGLYSMDTVKMLPTKFFEDNLEVIGRLAVKWSEFPALFRDQYPEMDALIARYYDLMKAGKIGTAASEEYFNTLSAELGQLSEDARAKLEDAANTLETMIGGQFSGKQMRYMKQNWSNALQDIDKTYFKEIAKIAKTPIGPNQATQQHMHLQVLNGWRRMMQDIIKINVQTFRGNWAEAMGFTPRQTRAIVQMPVEIRPYVQSVGKLSPGIEGSTLPDMGGIFGQVSPGIEGTKNPFEGYTIEQKEFDKLQEWANAWKAATEAINDTFKVLSSLAEFLNQVGWGAAGAILNAAVSAGQNMHTAMTDFMKAKKTGDYAGMAAAGLSAGAAFAQSINAPTKGQRMAGGAASGAMAGMSIGFMFGGPLGAGIGAGIGAISGLIAGAAKKDPGYTQVMHRVGSKYGAAFADGMGKEIGETLAKKIEEDSKKLFKGDWQAAEIFNLGAIMEDTGGVNTANIDKWSKHMSDIFSMLQTGKFTMDQATKAFDDGFSKVAQAVVDSNKIASPAFLNMIQLVKQFGMESKALTEFLTSQLSRAMTAWAKVASPLTTWATDVAEAKKALGEFQKELEKSGKYDPKTGKYFDLGVEDQKQLDELNKKIEDLKGNTKDASVEAERLGRILLAAFNGAVKSGLTFFEAMDQIGPQLDTLIKLYKDLGLTSENAALNQLMHYQELYSNNKELVEGVRALNELTLALSNLGALDAQTLSDLEAQGLAMYDKMVEAGFTTREAMAAMLPWIRTVMEAHEKLGIPIDENTQKIIDLAKAAGLLEEMDPTEVMRQGFESVVNAIRDLIAAITGIPRRIDIDTYYNQHGKPPDPYDPNVGPQPDPQALGGHYWVTRPTLFLAGEAGPEEAVFSGANKRLPRSSDGSGSSAASTMPPVNITIQALDPLGLKKVVEEEVAPMLVSVWRRNVAGLRTDTRKELLE